MNTNATRVEATGVGKTYLSRTGRVKAIDSIDLAVQDGEFVSIVGPSGCGKSTFLNMVAGFQNATSGKILVDQTQVRDGEIPKGLGYIFQKDTVLPWLSVERNVSLGLRLKGVPGRDAASRVTELLALANLQGCEAMYPHQLSGGMRQRVALLMTLAMDPSILLLDEPFGALDSHTKIVLHEELLNIWSRLGQTVVMVTHDLGEAITLSDRVIVLSVPPSRIVLDHRIDIQRPRDVYSVRETSEFSHHFQTIWRVLSEEFRRGEH